MRLSNDSYKYRLPKLTLKIFLLYFTNHTQYRARTREHNNTMENLILNFTHLFHVQEH